MRIRTREMILVALFAALTAAGAFIKIPVGPTPITLSYLFIALAAMLLGPVYGSLSQLIYVAIGLLGVPIFTAGGGPQYVFHPAFGYLIGYIIAPLIVGNLYRRAKKNLFAMGVLSSALGVIAVYAIGAPYMYMILKHVMETDITFAGALYTGMVIFLPGDALKCILASALAMRLVPILKRT